MAHLVYWQKDTFYYPIGNTPAANLAQDLPPEVDADVLLLGSGDCRSILYTVHTDIQVEAEPRKLDFTCCDYEAAVFARNVLLSSLIIDNANADCVWEIFYHPLLTDNGLKLLSDQCRKLLDLSTTFGSWSQSPYSFIRFATDGTHEEIRRLWTLYLSYDKLSRSERRGKAQEFITKLKEARKKIPGFKEGCIPMTAFRSAGPLAMKFVPIDDVLYDQFWLKGCTKGSTQKTRPLPHPNPTFSYSRSGHGFHMHYGSQPAQSFHLAPVMAGSGKPTPEKVIDDMRAQFATWCTAFRRRMALDKPNLVIRIVLGDALAVPHALRLCNTTGDPRTGVFANSWTSTKLDFVEEDYAKTSPSRAPTMFNVIDTSNLADHLGLINVLVVTIPLLRDLPSAVIHTNTLLSDLVVGPQAQFLFNLMCGDAIGIGTLLGVLPLQAISHFTTHYNKHEGIIGSAIATGVLPIHEPISWRRPVLPLPQQSAPQHSGLFSETGRYTITCDPLELADLLFSFYLHMFREECADAIRANIKANGSKGLRQSSLLHYSRESFACFLALVKERTVMDWSETMNRLLLRIRCDRTMIMGMNHYQDLVCQLYLRDVFALPQFSPTAIRVAAPQNPRLRGWKDVPSAICVILKVPRRATKIIEDKSTDEIGGPLFECQTAAAEFQNSHGGIQIIFGSFNSPTEADGSDLVIREDPTGWQGTSPLIISFYVPTLILVQFPDDLRVSLNLRPTPYIMMALKELAPNYQIFSTRALDTKHVQFARHRPQCERELENLRLPFLPPQTNVAPDSPAMLKFDATDTQVQSIAIRHHIRKPADRKALLEGATVETKPATDFVLSTSFGDYSHRFNYPCPVKGGQSRVRIARKSHYIEIEVPLRRDFENTAQLSMNPFLVVPHPDSVHLLNIHHVNLERCPTVDITVPSKDIDWLPLQLSMMYSAQDHALRKGPTKQKGGLVSLKESINDMLHAFIRQKQANLFVTTNTPAPRTPLAMVVANALRFDIGSHNIILDACVIPLQGRSKPMEYLYDVLPLVYEGTRCDIAEIAATKDETRLWDMFLLAMAERCRNWKHGPNCEYRSGDLPFRGETRPFCSCGKGKNVDILKGTRWAPWAPEAYRVAISPLFPLSRFIDTVRDMMKREGWIRQSGRGDEEEDSDSSSEDPAPASKKEPITKCARCSGPGKPNLSVCSGCKDVKYCSRDCQVADWKSHKKTCTRRS